MKVVGEGSENERTDGFEMRQHQGARAVSLLWAEFLDSSMQSATGKSLINSTLYCNMWFLWLLGKFSPPFGPHTTFAACCLNISLGNVTLFPFLGALRSGARWKASRTTAIP